MKTITKPKRGWVCHKFPDNFLSIFQALYFPRFVEIIHGRFKIMTLLVQIDCIFLEVIKLWLYIFRKIIVSSFWRILRNQIWISLLKDIQDLPSKGHSCQEFCTRPKILNLLAPMHQDLVNKLHITESSVSQELNEFYNVRFEVYYVKIWVNEC